MTFYPVVRDTIILLFKENVRCKLCLSQASLPKTTLTRKTIRATYPNSRWQMDLQKLPSCRGYEHACTIVDCHSHFAMGGTIKTKSAKAVCEVIVDCMQRYGLPRILQTENGKEFNNCWLAEVIEEMQVPKINNRPYHPQPQGCVKWFNQMLAEFFR